jgi:hypothetical protein
MAQQVLNDLATLFEELTGRRATRTIGRTGRNKGKNIGLFWRFLQIIWPIIFDKEDAGLISQFEKWADDR